MKSRHRIKAEKWSGMKISYTTWWNSLSITQKSFYKKNYENYVNNFNPKQNCPTPDTYNTSHLRLSQLSDKIIYRIWVFVVKDVVTLGDEKGFSTLDKLEDIVDDVDELIENED